MGNDNFDEMNIKEITDYIISELKEKDTMNKEDAGYLTYQQFLSDVHLQESNKYQDVLFDLDELGMLTAV